MVAALRLALSSSPVLRVVAGFFFCEFGRSLRLKGTFFGRKRVTVKENGRDHRCPLGPHFCHGKFADGQILSRVPFCDCGMEDHNFCCPREPHLALRRWVDIATAVLKSAYIVLFSWEAYEIGAEYMLMILNQPYERFGKDMTSLTTMVCAL